MAAQSKSAELPFSHELRVRYGECDAQLIVFNANYLAYVDVFVTELWRAGFGSYDGLLAHGVDAVVGETNLRFRASAKFDDVLRMEGGFDGLGTTSTVLKVRIMRGDELLIEVDLRYVFVDVKTWQKTPIPDVVRERLGPFLL
jgi:acyl-CoA thioester hydrolase